MPIRYSYLSFAFIVGVLLFSPNFGVAQDDLAVKLEAMQTELDELKGQASAVAEAQSSADTAWMLASSALVMLMIPGLALFYCGMVRRKNVLSTMMHSMAALGVVGVYWLAVGYSLAFGPSVATFSFLGVDGGGIVGWSNDLVFLKGIEPDMILPGSTIPVYVHMVFQGMFAIITPALISGAIAERIRFWPFCIFMILWVSFVYCPLAHMIWGADWFDPSVAEELRGDSEVGFLGKMGALDFAGGTVVHIAAGVAGLACALILGRRDGHPKTTMHPNSMVLTLLGAGLLWFGWFGFNGGSSVASDALAGSAFLCTQVAAAAAGVTWLIVEWLHKRKPTALGLASGIVAGLVAITPAAGFVYPWGAVAIGAITSALCYLAVIAKNGLGYDDSLDAFGIHGVGGFIGAVLTGIFCYASVQSDSADGFFAHRTISAKISQLEKEITTTEADGGDTSEMAEELKALKETAKEGSLNQFWIQFKACVFSVVVAFVLSLILCLLVQALTLGNFRTTKQEELEGLDRTEHGEVGFDLSYAVDAVATSEIDMAKPSTPVKGENRYVLSVSGATPEELIKIWSELCQPNGEKTDPDFLATYPHVTTVQAGSFRCRGGNAGEVAKRLESLFSSRLPGRNIKATMV